MTDDGRDAAINAAFTVLAVQFDARRHDFLLVMQDGVRNAGSCGCNTVFRAILAGKGNPSAFNSPFLQFFPVETEPFIVLGQFFIRLAGKLYE